MNVKDLLEMELPVKVKLKKDRRFDCGTILLVRSIDYGGDGVVVGDCESKKIYEIVASALLEDKEENLAIASNNWFNKLSGKFDLTIYEYYVNEADENGDFTSLIFAGDEEDCFELLSK